MVAAYRPRPHTHGITSGMLAVSKKTERRGITTYVEHNRVELSFNNHASKMYSIEAFNLLYNLI